MKKFFLFSAAFLISILFSSAPMAQQKTFKLILPGTYSVSGKSSSQMKVMTEEIAKTISEIANIKIDVIISPHVEEEYIKYAMQHLMSKDVDMVGFTGDWYSKFSESNRKKFPILFGIVFDKKKNQNHCFYTRKSDNIKNIGQLKGKVFAGYLFKDARYLMYKADINEPMDKFFGKITYQLPPYTDYMNMLVENKIDTFVSWDFNIKTVLGQDPRYKNIVPIGCQSYVMNPFILYRGDLDPALIDKIQKAVFNWKTDKRFEKFKTLFIAINGGAAKFTEADMKQTLEIEKLVQKFKWEDERKALIKKYGKK